MMDGDLSNHFLKDEEEWEVHAHKEGGNDAKSFLYLLNYTLDQDFSDDTVVYFLEDDYIHNFGWSPILLEAFTQTTIEYVTLYDHKDKYFMYPPEQVMAHIITTSSVHWRTTLSTTNTYAMKFRTLKKHADIHRQFCDLNERWTKDHVKFLTLWSRGSNLISSVPGYSTHCENEYMSPVVDWDSVMSKVMS